MVPNLQNALNAVVDPDTGEIVCQSRCSMAPIRTASRTIRSPLGGVTPEALNYLQVPGRAVGHDRPEHRQGVITGDLGTIGAKLPWADESIKVAFGVENRRDKLQNITDFVLTGGLLGVRAVRRSASMARPT